MKSGVIYHWDRVLDDWIETHQKFSTEYLSKEVFDIFNGMGFKFQFSKQLGNFSFHIWKGPILGDIFGYWGYLIPLLNQEIPYCNMICTKCHT